MNQKKIKQLSLVVTEKSRNLLEEVAKIESRSMTSSIELMIKQRAKKYGLLDRTI